MYWVCNPSDKADNVTVSLRVSGLKPMKWHPETGRISEVTYRFERGRTVLDLEFGPQEAYFLVLREKTKVGREVPSKTETVLCELPVEGLGCWLDDPATMYFSGTRSYRHTFAVPEFSGRLILDLGNVKNIAQVLVDGKDAGILWKAPFRADITDLVSGKSEAEIEIRVTNTWRNNLIGDVSRPVSERTTYTTYSRFFVADDPLSPAGLWGPVQLVMEN
jgi:hypothetical protein